ncbi:hypothetical protein DB42_AA00840 [Neochlamydia sp. EPS4]|uniref:hypothetical protein n=1 Tax=Neochlamydia sp. EPS4 TaxID=1478175 RepID=UPI0005832E48|nr:hypothetical protein [Neochlamydia sp. EPS4]KIC75596.1 hypothetical protein DB42_AA00840 [Neochlamydia sp. EPS4]
MIIPAHHSHCDASLNPVSSEMARIKREVYRLRGLIGAFDETMQESAALTTDVRDAYLQELRKLKPNSF